MNANQNSRPADVGSNTDSAGFVTKIVGGPDLLGIMRRVVLLSIVPVIAAVSFVARSTEPPDPPEILPVALSSVPLYASATSDKPAIALALSVEYPTVGAQYVQTPRANTDDSYSNVNEYLGYYDAESCYTYNNTPTETPVTGLTTADYKRFDRTGAATDRKCTNAFSGNFLNWASSSAIDMLRLALTGGDRYIDTTGLTILQRAVLPNGDPICMWNSTNFPAKHLARSGAENTYFGAVPDAMATAAGTNDIWVANTLNRIYFGTAVGGGCNNTVSYTLGGTTTSAQIGPITSSNRSTDPSESTWCANESGTCTGLTSVQEVWYGAPGHWKVAPVTDSVACTNAVFGDPIVGTGKKCYYRAYSGDWTPTTATGGLNSDGFFYSRVQVCNKNAETGALQDARDYNFCLKYPNGDFKPTGVIQKYSDQLRLAAFGYLMDQTASYSDGGRYGGVLRAPMKFVGGKTFDINGIDDTPSTGNPKAEWDLSTGIFVVDPESDSDYGKSGVITYLNRFGRTGPVAGRYKKYDPVGELHYEVLRYLQGLQPSADAISGITPDMYDGFPAATTWSDPYGDRLPTSDYACLKSNIVVIGDVNTHDGNRLPTASAANNIPDIGAWRTVVQNFEKNVASDYFDGQGDSRTTGNPNGANTGVPSATSTSQIMGSAYWARTHDIRGSDWTAEPDLQRPGLRVKTFTFDVNEYADQNDADTRHYRNQLFMAAKYGGFESDPSNTSGSGNTTGPYNTWGNPFRQESGDANNDVWQDSSGLAGRSGEASTYFLQSDARSVLAAFDEIFKRGGDASRSIAGGAIQSNNLTSTAGNLLYQGAFDVHDWSGDVLAFPVTVTGPTATPPNQVSIGTTPTWTASTQLAAMSNPVASRNIVVGQVGATASPVASNFTWGTIGTTLQDALDRAAPALAADGLGEDRLNYLRGDTSKEGTTQEHPFRVRNGKLLGDIVNSGVVFSGAPSTSIRAANYAAFYTTNVSRTPAVFVGANDGMLHAFNGTTGDELFAYIPSWLGPNLSALTSPSYVNSHQSYVDSTPVVAEALVGSDWKTVLVSGTGGGGQGVFALDVTNPSTFSASKVMWEFTHADDVDMGNVVGRPQILKLRTSGPSATTATYKWFAVVGSGVNNYLHLNSAGDAYSSGSPTLFLLDLSKAEGAAWDLGTNYYKVSLPFDSDLAVTKATGLINFRAALGFNGEVTQIYMGDLHGGLWKLDFTGFGSSDWSIGKLSSFNQGSTASPIPMFIAKDDSDNVQPITMAPTIVYGAIPGTTNVLFGTGKYLEASDKSSIAVQSMYMVYDNGSVAADSNPVGASAISGRGRLQEGTVTTTTTTGTVTFPAFTLGRALSDDTDERSGWFFDFPELRERDISNATVSGGQAIFASLIPGASGGTGTCSAPGGGGNEYAIDIATGNGTSRVSTVGLLGDILQAELAEAGTTVSDNTGKRTKTIKVQRFQQGNEGIKTPTTSDTIVVIAGRLSWRQINNYQDLKNAP